MTKLERIWRMLSGPEKKKFKQLLKSNYPRLLPYLSGDFLNGKDATALDKSVRSKLVKLLIKFLSEEEARSELGYDRYFLQVLNAREENHMFPSYMGQARRNVEENSKGLDADYFLSKYFLDLEKCKFQGRQGGRGGLEFENLLQNLDVFFCLEKLRYSLAIMNQAQSFGGKQEVALLEPVITLIRKQNYFGVGLLEIYDCIYKMMHDDPDENLHFEQVLLLLHEYGNQFQPELLTELYNYAINYSIQKTAKGETENLRQQYLYESFLLYKRVIDNNFILENGRLSAFHLKNAISLAAKFADFEWAHETTLRFAGLLTEDYQTNATDYCLGVIHFYQDDLEEAEKQFRKVLNDHADIFYGFNTRIFLMKIYYLQYFTANDLIGEKLLTAETNSFRVYVERKKKNGQITDLHRNNYISFTRLIARLTRISLKTEDEVRVKKWRKLKDEILSDPSLVGQKWFLKTISQHLKSAK